MIDTRLILVDGIPGSGKTTTAKWLAESLRRYDIPSQAYVELDDPHPFHSFWSWDDGFCDDIEAPFDADRYTDRIISKAKDFVRDISASGNVYVIECYPFQSGVGIHLKMGANHAQIWKYYKHFQDSVSALDPFLIFFDPLDTNLCLRNICNERGAESKAGLIGKVVRSPYGRDHGLKDWEGMLSFFDEYVKLTRELFLNWRFQRLQTQPGTQSWESIRKEILQGLQLC